MKKTKIVIIQQYDSIVAVNSNNKNVEVEIVYINHFDRTGVAKAKEKYSDLHTVY